MGGRKHWEVSFILVHTVGGAWADRALDTSGNKAGERQLEFIPIYYKPRQTSAVVVM